MPVDVTVVIPYYEAAAALDRVLAGLDLQSLPADRFEVIIADDGSRQTPDLGARDYRISTVRQERRGFRAAAARNLGLYAASGAVVCFLDGDTVPGPDYLRTMTESVTVTTLAVGSRRHVDLTGWSAADVRRWLTGAGDPPPFLGNPRWLSDGYAATHDLRDSDDTSFRFVLSAVLAAPRALLIEVGGFDERFVGYGGEDWELAQRCWLAGADLRHLPEAVAYHDGPDLAGRSEHLAETKNLETISLAKRLTHPMIRGTGLVYRLPDIVVEADVAGWTLGQLVAAVPTWVDRSDVGVWLTGGLSRAAQDAFAEDPRIHTGPPPQPVTARCRYRVRFGAPVRLLAPCHTLVAQALVPPATVAAAPPPEGTAGLVTTSREWSRARRAGSPIPWRVLPGSCVAVVPPDVVVERLRQASP